MTNKVSSNNHSDTDEFDFESDFGKGDLADTIPVKDFDKNALQNLQTQIDDFYFNMGNVTRPRGPIVKPPPPRGPVVNPPPPQPPAEPQGGKPPNNEPNVPVPRVIPCDNVIIDESDGGNGAPPGGHGGKEDGPDIIEIPPGLENCVFTQHHQADNGDGWTVIVRIKDGRMKQVIVIDENGNRTPVHRKVGKIVKVHKDNNKITVVGKKRVCTYFVKTNRLLCVP